MRRLLPVVVCVALFLVSCEERPREEVLAPSEGPTREQTQREQLLADIGELKWGKNPADTKASKRYDDTVQSLIRRGSAAESELIDALRRSDDWAVRLGIVEVLQAIGTRACIPHLIAVLDDPEPLVAFRADVTLQELTKHSEIPKVTKDPSPSPAANGLPPVPLRDPKDLEMDAERRMFAAWHKEHGRALRSAWDRWWSENKEQINLE